MDRSMQSATTVLTGTDRPDGPTVPTGWFVALWSAAVLFHLAANGGELLAGSATGLLQLVMAAVAVVVLVAPNRPLVVALTALYLAVLWRKLPVVGNHEIVLGLVALLILGESLIGDRVERLLAGGRALLIVAYGFMAFSKWNWGFWDPVESCAVVFADGLVAPVGGGWLLDRTVVAVAVIVATTLIESAIPLLLLLRRTRPVGLVIAVGFHAVLALDPVGHVWDFSATLLPLFLAFADPAVHRRFDRLLAGARRGPMGPKAVAVSSVLAIQALIMGGVTPLPTWTVAFSAWLALLVLVGAVLFRVGHRPLVRLAVGPVDGRNGLARRHLPVVALAVAIGVGPYLGLRSAAAFNMYANLRVVDGDSNHLVVPALGWADDPGTLVAVDEPGSDPILAYYAERDLLVPAENMARHLAFVSDHEPAGADVGGGLADHLRAKLLFRRAVDGTGADRCARAWGPLG